MTSQVPAATPAKSRLVFPFLDLKAQHATIEQEVLAAVHAVLASQQFILGPEVTALEREAGEYLGAEFAIGCASGSDALVLALMALGVGPGDEVITPPFTFVATAGAIARLGAKPVFVDILPDTYNLDPAQLEAAIAHRTRAVIPVHLFGLSAEMTRVNEIAKRHGLAVIEDAAQSMGARYKGACVGTIGSIGCFSFFPSKNLGGAGDGGLVTTRDPTLAEKLKVLRVHGSRKRYEYEVVGINSRLDSLQAAILRVKLRYLDAWCEARRRNARLYARLFAEYKLVDRVVLPCTPEGLEHVFNQYTIRVRERDALRAFLRERGIPTEVYYPSPLHVQKAFAYLGYGPGRFPHSERCSAEVVSLPVYPELGEQRLRSVVVGIAEFFAGGRR